MEGTWLRVCVDVGQDGNATGYHVEAYEDWDRKRCLVGALDEQPRTAEETFRIALDVAVARWGIQHPLPF